MDNIIGLKELRQNMENYIKKVRGQGKSFVVVKKSQPVFKIVPLTEEGQWEEVVDFTKIKKGGVDINDILQRL